MTTPKGTGPWPGVLVIPGGGWTECNTDSAYRNAVPDLTAGGFATYVIDYRLAPPGKTGGQPATDNGRYPEQTDDVELALKKMLADPRCNGEAFAVGGSAGGYFTAWLQFKGLIKAGAALSPATQLDALIGTGAAGEKATNYAPNDLLAASPNSYLTKDAHLFLIAFQQDNMPANQYDICLSKLQAAGADYKAVQLPGAGHSWAAWHTTGADIVAFLKAHLGGSPSPAPTATPPPSATPAPSPSATPTPAQVSGPRGLIDLYPGQKQIGEAVSEKLPGWTNQNVVGLRFRSFIDLVEPTKGVFRFEYFDSAKSLGKKYRKAIGISVNTGDRAAAWQIDDGAEVVHLSKGDAILPWDPKGLQHNIALIQALGARYDGIDYFAFAPGGGHGLTTGAAVTAEDIALCDARGGLAAWSAAADKVIAAACQAFPRSAVILVASAAPYASPEGAAALQACVDRNMKLYRNLGVMNTSLNVPAGTGLPFQLVAQYAGSHSCLLQFVNSAPGFGSAPPLKGSVEEVIEAGIGALKGKGAIEVYSKNADDPALAPMLSTENAKLQP